MSIAATATIDELAMEAGIASLDLDAARRAA